MALALLPAAIGLASTTVGTLGGVIASASKNGTFGKDFGRGMMMAANAFGSMNDDDVIVGTDAAMELTKATTLLRSLVAAAGVPAGWMSKIESYANEARGEVRRKILGAASAGRSALKAVERKLAQAADDASLETEALKIANTCVVNGGNPQAVADLLSLGVNHTPVHEADGPESAATRSRIQKGYPNLVRFLNGLLRVPDVKDLPRGRYSSQAELRVYKTWGGYSNANAALVKNSTVTRLVLTAGTNTQFYDSGWTLASMQAVQANAASLAKIPNFTTNIYAKNGTTEIDVAGSGLVWVSDMYVTRTAISKYTYSLNQDFSIVLAMTGDLNYRFLGVSDLSADFGATLVVAVVGKEGYGVKRIVSSRHLSRDDFRIEHQASQREGDDLLPTSAAAAQVHGAKGIVPMTISTRVAQDVTLNGDERLCVVLCLNTGDYKVVRLAADWATWSNTTVKGDAASVDTTPGTDVAEVYQYRAVEARGPISAAVASDATDQAKWTTLNKALGAYIGFLRTEGSNAELPNSLDIGLGSALHYAGTIIKDIDPETWDAFRAFAARLKIVINAPNPHDLVFGKEVISLEQLQLLRDRVQSSMESIQ